MASGAGETPRPDAPLFGWVDRAALHGLDGRLKILNGTVKSGHLRLNSEKALVVPRALALDAAIQLVEHDVGALEDLSDHPLVEAVAVDGHPGVDIVQASVPLDQLVRERLQVPAGRPLTPDPVNGSGRKDSFEENADGLHIGSLASVFGRTV